MDIKGIALPLSALFDGSSNGRTPGEESLPLPEAMADTLRHRLRELEEVHQFKPGDHATWKPAFAPYHGERAKAPVLVLGYDVESYPFITTTRRDHIGRQDVVILELSSCGCCQVELTDRRFLQPWPATVPAGHEDAA